MSSSTTQSSQPAHFERKEMVGPDLERKTKIICTLGPASSTVEQISALLHAGMNVARFNFSHGTHESHAEMVSKVREACRLTGLSCALMLDTKGPEIRTGLLKGGKNVILQANSEFDLIYTDNVDYEGDNKSVYVDYKNLWKVVHVGGIVKIDDGLIVCAVTRVSEGKVTVRVTNTAELGQRKGVNLPGMRVDLPDVTEKDKLDFQFAVKHDLDFIAASFTRRAEAVREVRRLLGPQGKNIHIICKIENQEGLDKYDEILAEADGIMVARGDLGVEIPIQQVTTAQKVMIRKANIAGKPIITATQMLESMINNPRPTRAETSDVANAVFDGTDCVMLSGETAKGSYPVECVQTMSRICRTAENAINHYEVFDSLVAVTRKPLKRQECITSAAVKASLDLPSKVVVVLTESGSSARLVAKYKPAVPVLVLTPIVATARRCYMSRALVPLVVERNLSEGQLRAYGLAFAQLQGWVQKGDEVVVVSGMPSQKGSTNTIKIVQVE